APLCRPPSLPTRRSCELPRCGPIERRWVAGGSGTRVAVPWRLLAAEHTAHPVELGPERVLVGGVLLPPGHPEPGRELAMAAPAAAATVLPPQLGAARGGAGRSPAADCRMRSPSKAAASQPLSGTTHRRPDSSPSASPSRSSPIRAIPPRSASPVA